MPLITFESKGTWDCLLWRQSCQILIALEDKVTWHCLFFKVKTPETAYLWR